MARRTGEQHPNAKLTQEQADKIRASKMGPSELSRMYGVSKATVSLIKRGKLWAPSPPTHLTVAADGRPGSSEGGVVTAPPDPKLVTKTATTDSDTHDNGSSKPSVAVATPTKVVYDIVDDEEPLE